jgi:acyl-CoA thioester hydrolase
MDLLGHVNNVTYVDYLQEARVDMLRVHPPAPGGEELAEGVVVVRHEVTYLRPLVFRMQPVSVEVWVTEVRAATFTLAYEIFDETPDGRLVYLRARSVLTPYVFAAERPRRISAQEREVLERFLEPGAEPLRPALSLGAAPAGGCHHYPCTVRFSDVDAYRHVNNVKYFEYFQEARIALISRIGGLPDEGSESGGLGVVVAQVDVDYRAPIFYRERPYVVETWVSRVGRSSFTIEGHILDDGEVVSAAVVTLVAFDPVTGKARQLTERQRDRLSPPR